MSGPPSTIAPDALFLELSQMPRPRRAVDIPRINPVTGRPIGQLYMQILTQQEQLAASAAAEQVTRDLLKQELKEVPKETEARQGYDNVYANAACCEVLFRACKSMSDPKLATPFFPSPTEMRKTMTTDEIGVLMSHYLTTQAELGPIIAKMEPLEVDAWVKVLGEGGSLLPLDACSSGALKTLALTLAQRLLALSTDTSSVGSPPEPSGVSE